MKHKLFFIITALLFVCLTASKCKKDKIPENPVDQLPPETQIGANTFGCLVDGKVFVPKGSPFSGPILTCYYQYIYYPSPTGYVFQVSAKDKSTSSIINAVNVGFDSTILIEGKTYVLKELYRGGAVGNYRHLINITIDDYFTYNPSSGELTIEKFDEINQIVSGTFWFNAVNTDGDTVHITNGRFDMQFTK